MAPLRLWLVQALLALASGCAAAQPLPGSEVTLQGTLVLQGNAPFAAPVLRQDDATHWALEGMEPDAAAALQNRRVEVHAIVLPAPRTGVQLPALRVLRIRPVPQRTDRSRTRTDR